MSHRDRPKRRHHPEPMNITFRSLARIATGVALSAALASVSPSAVHADELKDGRVALAAGHYDEALALFEKASGQGYAEGRAGVGQVWLRRRNYEKALEAFEMSQKMDGNLALSYWGIGEIARRNEEYAAALATLGFG